MTLIDFNSLTPIFSCWSCGFTQEEFCVCCLEKFVKTLGFLLSQLLPSLTSGFGKKVWLLCESWIITFPCSDYLSIISEINPAASHKPSSASVLGLQVEELRCTMSQLHPWKHVGFLWQSHWAPKPSCVPAFALWLGLQGLQDFRCFHVCQD